MQEVAMKPMIQLHSGLSFWFWDQPSVLSESIWLTDIARGLSRMPRYGGHTIKTYRVAEHCVVLARYAKRCGYTDEIALCALLHDAAEGLGLTDLPGPIKTQIPGVKAIEQNIDLAVSNKFKTEYPFPAMIKDWDFRILKDERAQVMRKTDEEWESDHLIPLGVKIECWSERKCFRLYMREARRLLDRIEQRRNPKPLSFWQRLSTRYLPTRRTPYTIS